MGCGCSASRREPIITGDDLRLEADRQRQVCRVVDGDARTRSQGMVVGEQATHRHGVDGNLRQVGDEPLPLVSTQLAAPNLLPHGVACLRKQEIGSDVVVPAREPPARGFRVHLGHKPFDHEAGVNDEDAHRASRSSRMSAALSE